MPTTSKANKSYITKRPRHVALLDEVIAKKPQPNKYKAVKTYCTARHLHDSGKESIRCEELMLLEKAGEIEELEFQVPYRFEINDVLICIYKLDFRYRDGRTRKTIFEDCKGKRTDVYIIKRKMMKAFYGIEIFES